MAQTSNAANDEFYMVTQISHKVHAGELETNTEDKELPITVTLKL